MAVPVPKKAGHGQYHNLPASPSPNIPKSILTEKTNNPQALIQHPLLEQANSLRVTFAGGGQNAKQVQNKPGSGPGQLQVNSLANFHQNVYNARLKRPTTPPARNAVEEIQRKLQLYPHHERPMSAMPAVALPGSAVPTTQLQPFPGTPIAIGSSGAGRGRNKSRQTQNVQGGAGPVDVLFPEPGKKNKLKLVVGSSSGGLVANKSDDESTSKKSKKAAAETGETTKSKSRRSATNRSSSSNASRRTKSGKKLKKRKKSKFDEELEKELKKPAQLNEEYAQEINKITQILKAVTAFDESTSTENSSIHEGGSGRDNFSSFYTFTGGSRNLSGATSQLKPLPRRPFSGDELKQLLSSITRVVSLHQISMDKVSSRPAVTPTRPGTVPTSQGDTNEGHVPSLASTTTATNKGKRKKVKKMKKREKASSYVGGSQSDPTYNRNKPGSAGSSSPGPTGKVKAKSATGTGQGQGAKATTQQQHQQPLPRTPPAKGKAKARLSSDDGGSSATDLDKDPIKHAAFLRNYFEENQRLANKRSSDDNIRLHPPAGGEGAVVPIQGPLPAIAVVNLDLDEPRPQRKSLRSRRSSQKSKGGKEEGDTQ